MIWNFVKMTWDLKFHVNQVWTKLIHQKRACVKNANVPQMIGLSWIHERLFCLRQKQNKSTYKESLVQYCPGCKNCWGVIITKKLRDHKLSEMWEFFDSKRMNPSWNRICQKLQTWTWWHFMLGFSLMATDSAGVIHSLRSSVGWVNKASSVRGIWQTLAGC